MIITPNMVLGGIQLLDTLLGGSQPRAANDAPTPQAALQFRQAMQAARQAPARGLELKIGDAHIRTAADRSIRLGF